MTIIEVAKHLPLSDQKAIIQMLDRLRQIKGVGRRKRGRMIDLDVIIFPFRPTYGRVANRKLVCMKEEGEGWTVRAAIPRDGKWLVWMRGVEPDDRMIEPVLEMQFNRLAGIENDFRRMVGNGPAVSAYLLVEISTVVPMAVLTRCLMRWVSELPWMEGCGWDWFRLARADLEREMQKEGVREGARFVVRARLLGAFVRMVGLMEGKEK